VGFVDLRQIFVRPCQDRAVGTQEAAGLDVRKQARDAGRTKALLLAKVTTVTGVAGWLAHSVTRRHTGTRAHWVTVGGDMGTRLRAKRHGQMPGAATFGLVARCGDAGPRAINPGGAPRYRWPGDGGWWC
jgi:hypothetical protein